MARGIPANGFRMTAKRKAEMAKVEVVPSKFSVSDRFKFINQFIKMIGNKKTNSLIITGDPGLGKSYSVVENLKSLEMDEIFLSNPGDFIVIKGFSTARALYNTLYEYNDKVIVFDDADAIHKDATASNLLKAALDSGVRRILSWNTSRTERDDDIPNRFEFTGRCIFISNMSIREFPQALLSRSYCVDLTLTLKEKLDRIDMVIHEYEGKTQEVMEFFRNNAQDFKDVSIRSALSVLHLANAEDDWKELATYTMTV